MKTIQDDFPISDEEYSELHREYARLAYSAAWKLIRFNTNNNHQNDIDDFKQDLLLAAVRAGSYHKRQVYIESSLSVCREYAKDQFIVTLLDSLQDLWDNRKRHGANRQKFGRFQEKLLDQILRDYVPKARRPKKKAPLVIDEHFGNYCKQIIWNTQRAMGKKITKEKPLRSGQVSISEFGEFW